MKAIVNVYSQITQLLNGAGEYISLFFLRLILAWEFLEAGVSKMNGTNWFESIKEQFIFPFNSINTEISWFLATWAEVLGGIALFLGLFTRFFSFSLIILTIVAMLAVHWPADWSTFAELWEGYTVRDTGSGNFKLPLLFLVMLIPLLFTGPGKLSLDHVLKKYVFKK